MSNKFTIDADDTGSKTTLGKIAALISHSGHIPIPVTVGQGRQNVQEYRELVGRVIKEGRQEESWADKHNRGSAQTNIQNLSSGWGRVPGKGRTWFII